MSPREGSIVAALLGEIARRGPLRTAQLAESAGVTSSSVSAILAPYCQRGQVVVCKVSRPAGPETNEYRLGAAAPAAAWAKLPPAVEKAPATAAPPVPDVPSVATTPAAPAVQEAPCVPPVPAAQPTRAPVSMPAAKPAAKLETPTKPATSPRFALWSDGTLVIETPEVRAELPEPYTRALLAYLDRVCGGGQ